jgi:nitrogen fixation NifU-like protein
MTKDRADFLQDHSIHYLEMALSGERLETVKNPDGYGENRGECGDAVAFFLTIRDGRIASASFEIYGCLNTHACANTVAHLAEGKTVAAAWDVTSEDVVRYLETLPPESTHCAELAVGAFYLALQDYQARSQSK